MIAVPVLMNNQCLAQVNMGKDSLSPGKRLSILNDKYAFSFPAAAKNLPRVADIMAADPNINKETRIILESADQKLVFFAQELFSLAGDHLFEDINEVPEPAFGFSRRILKNSDSLLAILSTPSRFDTSTAAILINSLMVKSPDNTVSRVDAYINPAAFSKKENYRQLSEEVFTSIQKGSRRIILADKQETYKIFGTESKLVFDLPKGYYITVDEKYDFGVFKINKFKKDINDTTYAGVSVYAGHHPNFFHADYGYKFEQAVKATGNFLSNPVDWMYFKDDAQSFYLKEQVIPVPDIQNGLVLHVSMLTNRKEILEELNKIVESIKLLK
jgi:hypothetical protein